MRRKIILTNLIVAVLAITVAAKNSTAQGVILQAAGPVHRSMGGASVAAPIDAIGALYWNPASISGMRQSETAFSLDFLLPNHSVASSIGAFSGTTEADAGAFAIPNVGWVHRTPNEKITFGVGVNSVAGFGTNLPADPTNPILAPQPAGLGQIASSALFLQIAPVISIACQDNLAFAFGPTITTGRLSLEPFVFESANADGSYATGHASRYHWGGGFQLGTYYILNDHWRFGASLKSTQWMERFTFNGEDSDGMPRVLGANIDLPMIVSVGTSYSLNEKNLIALDLRYFDYANTDGLGDPAVFDATGALGGLDFRSVFSTALGWQHIVNEFLTLRGGYTYNQNPISHSEAMFNVASPVIFEHMISGGASLNFGEQLSLNVAYSHYLENTRSGPVVLPGIGAVPGSRLDNTMDANLFTFGITVRH
jgi:long-chain fatty acid transport protein